MGAGAGVRLRVGWGAGVGCCLEGGLVGWLRVGKGDRRQGGREEGRKGRKGI